MDNSLIAPYAQALSAQTNKLEGYLDSSFKTIAVPANISQIESSKRNMLGVSAICFAIVGVIILIVGFVTSSIALIITGAAGLLSGGYLNKKSRQAKTEEAYEGLSTKIYGEISVITDKISSEWKSFIGVQNDNLKKQIVSSSDPTDSKVDMIDKVETSPAVKVDLQAMQSDLQNLATKQDLVAFSNYRAKAYNSIKDAIASAGTSQQGIYNAISGKTA